MIILMIMMMMMISIIIIIIIVIITRATLDVACAIEAGGSFIRARVSARVYRFSRSAFRQGVLTHASVAQARVVNVHLCVCTSAAALPERDAHLWHRRALKSAWFRATSGVLLLV